MKDYSKIWPDLISKTKDHYFDLVLKQPAKNADRPTLPILNQNEWDQVVNKLEYDPGEFVKGLYTEVGSGFVGPGFGTLPIASEHGAGICLLDYSIKRSKYYDGYWPKHLLGLVDWGCGIISCIDCSDINLPVIRFEASYKEYEDSFEKGDEENLMWGNCFGLESTSIYEWWQNWLDGRELFDVWLGGWKKYEQHLEVKKWEEKYKIGSAQMPLNLDFNE